MRKASVASAKKDQKKLASQQCFVERFKISGGPSAKNGRIEVTGVCESKRVHVSTMHRSTADQLSALKQFLEGSTGLTKDDVLNFKEKELAA
eukprot:7936555-Alexandrium_andersonii.AAC.1